jgi:hypothetical protein
MRRGLVCSTVLTACLALAATATAQFGHPLKGSWSGDWGSTRDGRTHVLLDVSWNGKTLDAVLNPGPNAVPLKTTLNTETWTVKFEGDGKDKSGATVHYVIDGKLENLGAAQRFISGTWTQGSAKGDFRITRN